MNQDTLHNTGLTPDAMSAKNTDIYSWTALTKFHLQTQQHSITRLTETATPGQALECTEKIKKEDTGPDHSLDIADITAPAAVTCTEAASNHNKRMDTATIKTAQGDPIQHKETTVTEPTMTHHTGHTADHPVTTLRTTVDHIHTQPTDH